MRKTTKFLAIGAALAIGTLGGYAIAQPGPGMMGMMGHDMMGRGMGPGMGMRGGPSGNPADAAARVAALKTELGIRADQTTAWDAYAAALQSTGEQMRTWRPTDMNAMYSMSPPDRLAFMTGMQTRRDTSITAIRSAAEALLPALNEAQKAKAQQMLPGLSTRGHGMMRHAGMTMPFAGPGNSPAR